eukprot:4328379-Alexandrium_andersonii.AAC.1
MAARGRQRQWAQALCQPCPRGCRNQCPRALAQQGGPCPRRPARSRYWGPRPGRWPPCHRRPRPRG